MSIVLSGDNGVSEVDGSASTPAIRGTDANTGIFFPAADTIAFAEGGVEAARLDSNGNLLVGTTTAAQKLTINGYASVNSNNISADNSLGFRNRIINGDMRIDQRNAGASVTITSLNGQYTVDRWNVNTNQASKVSVQQSTTAPAGFNNSALITSLSAFSAASGDYFGFVQYVEGFNAADFGWGTANAQTVTLSFRVRASITGTYTVAIGNSAQARSYVATFTVNSANTYETKTITIAGDTSGTWLTNNGIGLRMWFDLGSGSTFNQASANTWTASNTLRTSGSVSLVGTNGATFYITGVQLEVGSVATPFERRPYGTELQLCQRYFYKTELSSFGPLYLAHTQSTTSGRGYFPVPVTLRTVPTGITTGGSAFGMGAGGYTSTAFDRATTTALMFTLTGTSFTAGGANIVFGNGDGSSFISVSVEL